VVLTAHLHPLLALGGDVLSDIVGPNRKLAVAPIDQADELDRLGSSKVHQRVHRGADGAPGIDHVVDKNDDPIVDSGGHFGAAQGRAFTPGDQIVSVERRVEDPHGHRHTREYLEVGGEPTREGYPPIWDRDKIKRARVAVALEDLVRDALERTRNRFFAE
jgi:hypothetical protein